MNYIVTFRRRETAYASVDVEADNEQQAKRRARKRLDEDDFEEDPWCDSDYSRPAVVRIETVP